MSSYSLRLVFDENDIHLWNAIQRLSPENRNQYLLKILSKVLLKEDITEDIRQMKKSAENGEAKQEIGASSGQLEKNEFSLEELFLTDNPSQKSFSPAKPAESQRPWEHLLNNVIGKEEDQEVIKAINDIIRDSNQHSKAYAAAVEMPTEKNNSGTQNIINLNQAQQDSLEIVNLEVVKREPLQGVKNLMQIIGEEDDEEIINLFKKES